MYGSSYGMDGFHRSALSVTYSINAAGDDNSSAVLAAVGALGIGIGLSNGGLSPLEPLVYFTYTRAYPR